MDKGRSGTRGWRVVLVVCEGLRADWVRPPTMPFLAALATRATVFPGARAVFPGTAENFAACLATGTCPASHGLYPPAAAWGELALAATGAQVPHAAPAPWARSLARRFRERGGCVVHAPSSAPAASILASAAAAAPHRAHHPVAVGGDAAAAVAALAERAAEDVRHRAGPALTVLWLAEPGRAGRHHALGGPEHLRALAAVDACLATVVAAVEAADPHGRDVLLVVTSDGGLVTAQREIALEALLVEAGFKSAPDDTLLLAVPTPRSVLFFLHPAARRHRPHLLVFLEEEDWVGTLYSEDALRRVGLAETGAAGYGLAAAVSLRHSPRPNAHGIPGGGDYIAGTGVIAGAGCTGGSAADEQHALLLVRGGAFPAGARPTGPATPMELTATLLHHCGLPCDGLEGWPLQTRLLTDR